MTITDLVQGEQGFFIMMSTAIAASGTVVSPYMVPDGEVLTLEAATLSDPAKTLDRRKPSAAKKVFKTLAERLDLVVHMKNCTIRPTAAAGIMSAGDNPWGIALPAVTAKTATANLKLLKEWCFKYGVQRGGDLIYLFAWNNAEEEWYPFAWDDSNVMVNYLQGRPLLPQPESGRSGKIYTLADFAFENVNIG